MSETQLPIPVYDETYSHLQEVLEHSQSPLARLKDAIYTYLEIGRPLQLDPGDTLLDIGAGLGRPGHYLRHFGINTVNVDINPAALEASQSLWHHNRRNYAVQANGMAALPFANASVDAVMSQDYLEHIHPSGLEATFAEMTRVLKGDRMIHRITVTEEPHNMYADKTHQTFWSAPEWKEWFAAQGWHTEGSTQRQIYAPKANLLGLTTYCHGYFLLSRQASVTN